MTDPEISKLFTLLEQFFPAAAKRKGDRFTLAWRLALSPYRYEDVKAECEWAKARGIKSICGHDYGNPNPRFGVTRAVDEVFGKENVEVVGMCWRVKR